MNWLLLRRMDSGIRGDLYLRRWILLRTPWFQILLHKIVRPDADRDLHNHPWPFFSLILRGGYVEEVLLYGARVGSWSRETIVEVRRKPGRGHKHSLSTYHRIDRLLNGPAWTLVFTTGKRQQWGFLVNGVFKYINYKFTCGNCFSPIEVTP